MSLYLIHEALLRWMIFASRGYVSWSNLSPADFALKRTIPLWILPMYLTFTILAAYLMTEFIEKPAKNILRSREK